MAIICNVDYNTALEFKGYNLKGKYQNKNQQIYLRVTCDDRTLKESIDLARGSKNILMLEYQGVDSEEVNTVLSANTEGVYIGKVFDFGNNIKETDIENLVADLPVCVVPIISLPDDFKDLELLYHLSKKFPNVRFCGGQLFSISGVKVGAIGVDTLAKRGIKFSEESYRLSGTKDVIECVDFDSLTIEKTTKAEKTTKKKKGNSKTPNKAKKKARGISMSDMFSDLDDRGSSIFGSF